MGRGKKRGRRAPKQAVIFEPKKGEEYQYRTAFKDGESFPEILHEGKWWRLWKNPDKKNSYLLSDPEDPGAEGTIQAPE